MELTSRLSMGFNDYAAVYENEINAAFDLGQPYQILFDDEATGHPKNPTPLFTLGYKLFAVIHQYSSLTDIPKNALGRYSISVFSLKCDFWIGEQSNSYYWMITISDGDQRWIKFLHIRTTETRSQHIFLLFQHSSQADQDFIITMITLASDIEIIDEF